MTSYAPLSLKIKFSGGTKSMDLVRRGLIKAYYCIITVDKIIIDFLWSIYNNICLYKYIPIITVFYVNTTKKHQATFTKLYNSVPFSPAFPCQEAGTRFPHKGRTSLC